MPTHNDKMESQQSQGSYWPSCTENSHCIANDPAPTVTVLFHGLLALSCNSRGECEVGILNTAYNHKLRIEVYEVPGCSWEDAVWSSVPPEDWKDLGWEQELIFNGWAGNLSRDIILDAVNPVVEGVHFHQIQGNCNLVAPSDEKDFRRVIDLEGIYGETLEKISDAFKPKIHVRCGEFYALQMTKGKFQLEGNGIIIPRGSLPRLIAARINLNASGHVSFKFNGVERTYKKNSGKQHLILFANDCGCDSEKDARKGDGDFFRYFEAVYPPGGKEKYQLKNCSQVTVAVNDFAPCAGIGFGKSGGLP